MSSGGGGVRRGQTADLFDNLKEEWRAIDGFPGYEVSSLGRVRTVIARRFSVAGQLSTLTVSAASGYVGVRLRASVGLWRSREVHRLVCVAFHGAMPASGWQACHLDGNSLNNAVANLCWQSPSRNALDRHRHGTMPAKLSADDVRVIRAEPARRGVCRELAERFGVTYGHVRNVRTRTNRTWGHIREPETGDAIKPA